MGHPLRERPEGGAPGALSCGLPLRLTHLYTYRDDLVLDPFLGSGASLVAAKMSGRRGVGYDIDPTYVEMARERLAGVPGEDYGMVRALLLIWPSPPEAWYGTCWRGSDSRFWPTIPGWFRV